MNCRWRLPPFALLALTALYLCSRVNAQPEHGSVIDNRYLTITILRGWTVRPSPDQRLDLIRGQYVLSINPIFAHASGVEGGRFSEIVNGMHSVDAVMLNVDQPAGGFECAQRVTAEAMDSTALVLGNLYTDSKKTGSGCVFPSSGQSVWFGSFFSGNGPGGEYTITLDYDTTDVDALPKKGSPTLKRTLLEVTAMLKTLRLKPLFVLSRIDPSSAPPGATVTVYGAGFDLPGYKMIVRLSSIDTSYMPYPVVAPDGKSMTFQVPTSNEIASCQEGRVQIGGFCLPIPPGHVDVNDCPRLSWITTGTLCGVPVSPGTGQLSVAAESSALGTDPVPFTITAAKPTPVSISLLYPNALVSPGDTIIVRGSGFTAAGNTIRIGSSVVANVPSVDGHNITFAAPSPSGASLLPQLKIYDASVSNANGESNPINFVYR